METTISAIATALGQGAVGIIRLSGEQALSIGQQLFRPAGKKQLGKESVRELLYGHAYTPEGRLLDEVLAVYMEAPHSYTGEDVVELQCHGGLVALQELLAATYAAGAQPAEPGEFTKRAFLNGRMDLTQAEAVMDIINARSSEALQVAQAQHAGRLAQEIKQARATLLELIVQLEAKIDYPEDDVEEVTYQELLKQLQELAGHLSLLLANAHTGKLMREGLKTAIVGRPNVGKSSLLNCLLKEERAIVSDIPGTTRDLIQEQLLIAGIPLVLTDTAGIRATEDTVEQIGVERTRRAIEAAELIIAVIDGSQELTEDDKDILGLILGKEHVVVVNKGDLPCRVDLEALKAKYGSENFFTLSAKTTSGIEGFVNWLKKYAYGNATSIDRGIFIQNVRQETLVREALQSVESAIQAAEQEEAYDCIEIDLRNAIALLGEITGETVKDEIINEIFSKFCLGK